MFYGFGTLPGKLVRKKFLLFLYHLRKLIASIASTLRYNDGSLPSQGRPVGFSTLFKHSLADFFLAFYFAETVLVLLLLNVISVQGAPKRLTATPVTIKAHLASGWYPSDPAALTNMINALERKSANLTPHLDPNQIRALVVPHAGYAYSGVVAAATYKIVEGAQFSRVIILAPSHHKAFTGVALPTFGKYGMPQGNVIIDAALVKELSKQKLFTFDDDVFKKEHAVEVQLPFVQRYLKNVSVVPLIIGQLTTQQANAVAKALAPFIDKQTLVVVSTDFTHYGKQFDYTPFDDHVAERIKQLDATIVTAVQQQKVAPLETIIKETQATVCGRKPLAVLLALCEQKVLGAIEPRLIAYETSSDAGATGSSVSYVGLVFTTQKRATQSLSDQFTSMEQQTLLELSKGTLASLYDASKANFLFPLLGTAGDEKRGVFVTLYKKNAADSDLVPLPKKSVGDLRGCIGIVEPSMPLAQGIVNMTQSAALRDTRFKPVSVDELPDITVMLSILSVPVKIPAYSAIQLGTHGIILKNGNQQALFLPKVALEFGWDLPTTLTQLSQKAGLPALAWKDPKTEFQVFMSLDIPAELASVISKGSDHGLIK